MKKATKRLIVSMVLLLPIFLSIFTLGSSKVEAKEMNLEKTGSLTIHKLLNPNYRTPQEVGEDYAFQGDGTASGINLNGGENISGTPLPGVEFIIVGRLTNKQITDLEGDNGYITTKDALDFIENLPAGMTKNTGVTNENGIVEFTNLPVNTDKLDENKWLVVESNTPTTVDTKSLPVIVNVPVATASDTDKNAYNYDVHLFMKNYSSDEPEIEKEIDESTHSTGDRVLYNLKINELPDDINTYKRLDVYDELDARLSLLGTSPHNESIKAVTLKDEDGKVKTEFKALVTADKNKVTLEKGSGYDVIILTGDVAGNASKGQFIYWGFTPEGIEQMTDLDRGDYIDLPFEAVVNANGIANEAIPNQGDLGFTNDWGYGTKPFPPTPNNPTDPTPTPTKPTEVVNTIFGKKEFIKKDADTETVLKGAEFIVKDTPVKAINTKDKDGNKVTLPAGKEIYAVIENGRVVRWTSNKKEATPIVSDDNGKFSVDGLAYTNRVHFSKEYIFQVTAPLTIKNDAGEIVTYQPEKQVVKEYITVAAATRTAKTTEEDITNEIEAILTEHPDYIFYKESETNPGVIDYLGEVLHDYSLEEIVAPDGYVPLGEDLKFTVPGKITGEDVNGRPIFDHNASNVFNKKVPSMPITGGIGTIIFLVIGAALIGVSYFLKRRKAA